MFCSLCVIANEIAVGLLTAQFADSSRLEITNPFYSLSMSRRYGHIFFVYFLFNIQYNI